MENKIVFLLILIVALWLLLNPKSREWIKASTVKIFAAPAAGGQ